MIHQNIIIVIIHLVLVHIYQLLQMRLVHLYHMAQIHVMLVIEYHVVPTTLHTRGHGVLSHQPYTRNLKQPTPEHGPDNNIHVATEVSRL